MDDSSFVYYLEHCDLVKIKEFISQGGDVLKPLPEIGSSTALKYILDYYFNYDFLSFRDEIILYLIEEETKARHAKNMWNVTEWTMYIKMALYNIISEKIVLNLIHVGSTNITDFKIGVHCISAAVKYNYSAEVISNLLKCCCEDDLKTKSDELLFKAIRNDRGIDVIKALVDAGANLNYSNFGMNLFHKVYCECCNGCICKSKHIIDFLVKNCIDIKVLDNKWNTIIHSTNCQYLIKLAIQNGVSIEQKNYFNFTPLMQAIDGCKEDKANVLLQLGADPNSALSLYQIFSVGRMQKTYCMESLIDVLLFHGADFLASTVENESLINYLLRYRDILMGHLKKIVSYYAFFMDTSNFSKYFPQLSNSAFWSTLLENCKVEQNKMKSLVLNGGLTFYEFCNIKKFYKSKFVDISVKKYELNNKVITVDFPIYHDFIKIRIKDNVNKRWEKMLRDILENIIIAPLNNLDDMVESIELNYDCLYYLSKFLNSEDLNILFLASTSE